MSNDILTLLLELRDLFNLLDNYCRNKQMRLMISQTSIIEWSSIDPWEAVVLSDETYRIGIGKE